MLQQTQPLVSDMVVPSCAVDQGGVDIDLAEIVDQHRIAADAAPQAAD